MTYTSINPNPPRRLPAEAQLTLFIALGFILAMGMVVVLIMGLPRGSEPAESRAWLAAAAVTAMSLAMVATLVLTNRVALRRMKLESDAQMQRWAREQSVAGEQLREAGAQEARNRLARDLHDSIKQQLFGINVAAATAQSLEDHAAIRQQLQQVRELSQTAMVEMKALLTQLRPRPLDTMGLIGAIQEQLDALKFRAEVTTELHAGDLPDEAQMPAGTQAALFRVAQEALSNIARHARASRVVVLIERVAHEGREWLRLSINDDGQGFDMALSKTGMGLGNMRARISELGGALAVQSAVGKGATVTAEIPLTTPRDLRERAQREKEERSQLVYGAGGATSMLAAIGVMSAIALAVMALEIANGNPQMWAAFVLTLALGTAMCLGLLFVTINLRRRVLALGDEHSIWHASLRFNDAAAAIFIFGTLAWVLFTFKQFGLAALFALAAAVAAMVCHRLHSDLDGRIGEWATFRLLRTRQGEYRALLVFGLVLVGLTLAGMFGDVRRFRLFHEGFDSAWAVSFILFAYPLVIVNSAFALISTRRQIAQLQAIETDDEASEVPQSASIVQQRRLARVTSCAFMASAALIGIGFGMGSVPLGLTGLAVCGATWFMKARIERQLTRAVHEWSTLEKQRSAQLMYIYILVLAVVMIAGGFVGAMIGYATPSDINDAGNAVEALPRLLGLLTAVVAAPAYLVMMLVVTRQRIRRLMGVNETHG